MAQTNSSILVIEDDREIGTLLEIHLQDRGHLVSRAEDGLAGLALAQDGEFDLVILDLMLPGLDGMEVCKRIRKDDRHLPILMLTARSEEIDKILGLELGADDYLTKPFSIRELLARTSALLRRSNLAETQKEETSAILDFGALQIDIKRRRAVLDGTILDLTAKEWELLLLLAKNPGRTYSRQELLDLVWGYQYEGYSHTVNSHINRLRSKVERDPARPEFVLTKRGLGYRFVDPKMAPEVNA